MMTPRRRSDAPLNARPAANVRLAPMSPRTPRTQTSSVLDHELEVLERERALAARETRLEAREGQIADDRQRVEAMQQSLQEESKELREKMEHESKALREREKAIHEQMQHESKALREREAALREREAAIREREGAIHAREEAFHEREGALRERESKLERRTLPPSVRSADERTDHDAASSEPKRRSRHADPMDDVPALVEAFVSSGHIVPLGVHVAEVQALQQAATRLKVAAETCEHQLEQLAERAPLVVMPSQKAALEATRAELQAELEKSQRSSTTLVKQFTLMRDAGIERFMPLLLATVEKYDAQFERCALLPGAEEALRRIGEQCSRCVPHITTTGRELRQPLPSALPHTEQATLMMLLSVALHAAPELNLLAEEAVAGLAGCEVLHSPKPVKGIHRCMQKVQEEYEGDYTRLLDLARVTIICDTIVELERILSWLLSGERAPRFEACRTKDRLSRSWDAELSGGNRDVMVNGWLSMGGHRKMIVEVQLHVRALFELKGDLHVLYAGARVLGAMEDLMVGFDGKLSSEVLERVRNGVLRKLGVACSPMDAAQIATLKEILHHEPCALLQLDLSNCTIMTDDNDDGGSEAPPQGMKSGWRRA